MNEEQIKSLIEQLKGVGLEEEQIMDVFYETFKRGKMDRKDLEAMAEAMGYELTDDFKEDSHEDPIEGGEAKAEELGDISKEDLEEAKEIKPGESKEEFEEKLEDMGDKVEDKIEDKVEDKSEPEKSEPEMEEEKKEEEVKDEDKSDDKSEEDMEWEEAQKLFKI